ncbi:hypothetical protein SAMN06295905_1569 [Devosia lucknowensis]|uniref:Uncharacterized protein n=1 Tax=Devosia lucknowensis TaxID=1096929 RepID=A0A1Y6EYL9_9HYPH|nr:hypothetical protein [Devosia lucknowensis]SMQ67735.1 hypothetical protein SAMN06295905_1569 [Devosia lucknowensis]
MRMFVGTSASWRGLAGMVRSSTLLALRMRVRLVLMVMVAVAASMTLHHGAMASGPVLSTSHASHEHHHGDDCHGDCSGGVHSMPMCCGMGLCLSGLPVSPQASLRMAPVSVKVPEPDMTDPRWPIDRIDRPPKPLLDRA